MEPNGNLSNRPSRLSIQKCDLAHEHLPKIDV
jgi:hypothetical protein